MRDGDLDFGSSSPKDEESAGEPAEQEQDEEYQGDALSPIAAGSLRIIDAQRGEVALRRLWGRRHPFAHPKEETNLSRHHDTLRAFQWMTWPESLVHAYSSVEGDEAKIGGRQAPARNQRALGYKERAFAPQDPS